MGEFCFLFYPNDWAGGTKFMTRLQRSCYFDLLLEQVNNTSLSLVNIRFILGEDFENCWPVISSKFILDGDFYINKKLEKVLNDRKNFTESRRNNRLGKKKTLVKLVEKEKERVKERVDVIEKKIKNNKGVEIQKIQLPFDSENFARIWGVLSNEKKWRKKSPSALLASLHKLSKYNEADATQMMLDCIAGEWQGLVEPKNNFNSNNNGKSKHSEKLADLDRFAAETRQQVNDAERNNTG